MYKLILANVAKHVALTREEEEYFVSLLVRKTLKRKELLLAAGEVCRHVTFVNKGCLRTYRKAPDGKEHIVMFSMEDWWCSDLYSFVTKSKATFTIDALERSDVFQISAAQLEKLYIKVPKFERFFRILSQNAYIMYQRRIASGMSSSAEVRYKQFKKWYPAIDQRIAQKYIASYLGVTPEFLSMLRKKK